MVFHLTCQWGKMLAWTKAHGVVTLLIGFKDPSLQRIWLRVWPSLEKNCTYICSLMWEDFFSAFPISKLKALLCVESIGWGSLRGSEAGLVEGAVAAQRARSSQRDLPLTVWQPEGGFFCLFHHLSVLLPSVKWAAKVSKPWITLAQTCSKL